MDRPAGALDDQLHEAVVQVGDGRGRGEVDGAVAGRQDVIAEPQRLPVHHSTGRNQHLD